MRAASADAAEALAGRLVAAVAQTPVALGDAGAQALTVSVGWSTWPLPGATAALTMGQALRVVDKALYAAKAAGRNRSMGVVAAALAGEADLVALEADWAGAVAAGRLQLAGSVGAPKQST